MTHKDLIARTALVTALTVVPAVSQTTVQVNRSSAGVEANGASYHVSMTPDGRYVAFDSDATNLVASDTNNSRDVFVHDRLNGTTVRANLRSTGGQAAGFTSAPLLSANGRWVLFSSLASTYVPGDTNFSVDAFVRDMWPGGTTIRVSLGTGCTQGDADSFGSSISADGRYVGFLSEAANLVPGDNNNARDAFVHDRSTCTTTLVSVTPAGIPGNAESRNAQVTSDGRYVAFESYASDLVPNDTNGQIDVFVRDLSTSTTTRISVSSSGVQGDSVSWLPVISEDGRYVAFQSSARNLDGLDTLFVADVFLHDRTTATTRRLSSSLLGGGGNGESSWPQMSPDGRFVVFQSNAQDLVPGDGNGQEDVFLHDRVLGTLRRVNVAWSGAESTGEGLHCAVAADGSVAFCSNASDLVPGDTIANSDVFLRDTGAPTSWIECAGDGSATACPCGSAGGSGRGCPSSVSASGGRLAIEGEARVSADSLRLVCSAIPDAPLLYWQGTSAESGGSGAQFGDGLRCVGGTQVRIATRTGVGGVSAYPAAGEPSISSVGLVPPGGGMRHYQVWYRNAASFCTSATFNTTNGVAIFWAL